MPYVTVKGAKLHYLDYGDGPVVLLLHCWNGNVGFWRHQVESLAGEGYRVIALDFRGHGASARTGSFTIPAFADDVVELAARLRIADEPFVIAGHSMGGMVAMHVALHRPQLVRGLLLLNSSAALAGFLLQRIGSLWATRLLRWGLVPPFLKQLAASLGAIYPLSPADVRNLLAGEAPRVRDRVAAACLKSIRNFDVTARLGEIRVPALILVGRHDLLTDVRHAAVLARGIPRARLAVVGRAGHMTMLERPNEVNALVVDFLREIGYRKASSRIARAAV